MTKNKLHKKFVLLILLAIVFVTACKEDEETKPVLTVSGSDITIPAGGGTPEITISEVGGTSEITITCNKKWSINNPAAWLSISELTGNSGTTTIELSAIPNTTGTTRSGILTINSNNGQARRLTVSQLSQIFPSYNTSPKPPDATGMSSNAVELAAKMGLGLNIGNTFEAPGSETGWGSPVITEDFIKFVKEQGFNAIRLPCSWDWYHVDNRKTAHIDEAWLNRVKEVVGYCVDNDMYVLLNVHWDGGWLENNCTPIKKDSVNAKQKAYWEQIATAMRDFDEHLMFASANEPNADDATEMGVLLSYHQTFVNAVRSTGGRNTYRNLVIQGAAELMPLSSFPTDPTPNRMMYESHNYTPYQFCCLGEDVSWGDMAYYWGKDFQSDIQPDRNFTAEWGDEEAQIEGFTMLKEKYVDNGMPILMGEYGAFRRDTPLDLEKHNASVDHWVKFVTKEAKTRGIVPFWWDTGGLLDRQFNTVKDQRTMDSIIAGGN